MAVLSSLNIPVQVHNTSAGTPLINSTAYYLGVTSDRKLKQSKQI